MSFSPSFLASQSLGSPSVINLQDTSTGSDVAIVSRRVYLTTDAGTFLVPSGTTTDYITWAYINATTSIDVLENDMCLSVLVQWLDVSNNVLYSSTQLCVFTLYSETFYYGLTQNQTSVPDIINDTNYYNNKMILRCSIDEANNATYYGLDIYSAQSALNRAAYLIANQNDFF